MAVLPSMYLLTFVTLIYITTVSQSAYESISNRILTDKPVSGNQENHICVLATENIANLKNSHQQLHAITGEVSYFKISSDL